MTGFSDYTAKKVLDHIVGKPAMGALPTGYIAYSPRSARMTALVSPKSRAGPMPAWRPPARTGTPLPDLRHPPIRMRMR